MKYSVKLLPTAWEDLKTIEDYYTAEFSVDSAIKVSDSILDAIERLESFPDSGSFTPDEWLNEQGYKMIICGKFVAIHRQIGNEIYVYHIANTKTEYTKIFIKTC